MEEQVDFAKQEVIDRVLAEHAGEQSDVIVDALRAALGERAIVVTQSWLNAVATQVSMGERYVVNVETA